MSATRAFGLLLGVAADAAFGDPRRWHPVAGFGQLAQRVERVVHRDNRGAGAVYTAVLAGGAVGLGVLVDRANNPIVRIVGTAAATWVVLGGRSLAAEGWAIGARLSEGDVDAARERLPHLCGRDPSTLDEAGLARATVESVAENTSDAVVAPLLWGAVAGVPGLLGYRAVNTMDAMVGHKSPRYLRFGWASARLDDLVNLVPARVAAALTVVGAPAVKGDRQRAVEAWRRDAGAHPSPNAGQVEAAFAGALGVQLGGRTEYSYGVEERPTLGEGRAPDATDVARAVTLSRVVGLLTAGLAALISLKRRARGPHPRRGSRRPTGA
ncbi:adenosylcobinamide-phosphate synthase [Actinokineospora baliensis]|uniref:cobalamin biosynthesis protein n=1 Tax=Actinokineospora baliensis TaxID=547056 RepID=UPI001958E08F|nr:cobalamin biosynthesis protein [Actinokineospora baliensis]MBM7772145.1 adenosylcobinamide-phosphate synthase [Actinokineospora baliensis]